MPESSLDDDFRTSKSSVLATELSLETSEPALRYLNSISGILGGDYHHHKHDSCSTVGYHFPGIGGARNEKAGKASSRSIVLQQISEIQRTLDSFEYNPNGSTYNVDKSRPLSKLLDTGWQITKSPAKPIQCVEGALAALYLSHKYPRIQRFSISFQSVESNGKVRHHLVVGVYADKKFGAFGISRNRRLMNKPMEYNSLESLLLDFKEAYEDCGHKLQYITIGKPVAHDSSELLQVTWNLIRISCKDMAEFSRQCKLYSDRLIDHSMDKMKASEKESSGEVSRGRTLLRNADTGSTPSHRSQSCGVLGNTTTTPSTGASVDSSNKSAVDFEAKSPLISDLSAIKRKASESPSKTSHRTPSTTTSSTSRVRSRSLSSTLAFPTSSQTMSSRGRNGNVEPGSTRSSSGRSFSQTIPLASSSGTTSKLLSPASPLNTTTVATARNNGSSSTPRRTQVPTRSKPSQRSYSLDSAKKNFNNSVNDSINSPTTSTPSAARTTPFTVSVEKVGVASTTTATSGSARKPPPTPKRTPQRGTPSSAIGTPSSAIGTPSSAVIGSSITSTAILSPPRPTAVLITAAVTSPETPFTPSKEGVVHTVNSNERPIIALGIISEILRTPVKDVECPVKNVKAEPTPLERLLASSPALSHLQEEEEEEIKVLDNTPPVAVTTVTESTIELSDNVQTLGSASTPLPSETHISYSPGGRSSFASEGVDLASSSSSSSCQFPGIPTARRLRLTSLTSTIETPKLTYSLPPHPHLCSNGREESLAAVHCSSDLVDASLSLNSSDDVFGEVHDSSITGSNTSTTSITAKFAPQQGTGVHVIRKRSSTSFTMNSISGTQASSTSAGEDSTETILSIHLGPHKITLPPAELEPRHHLQGSPFSKKPDEAPTEGSDTKAVTFPELATKGN